MGVRGSVVLILLQLLLFGAHTSHAQSVKLSGRAYLPAKKASGERYDAVLYFAPTPAPLKQFSVIFGYNREGYYEVRFGPDGAELVRLAKKTRRTLAHDKAALLPHPLRTLTVRRSGSLLAVLVNGRFVCRAIDSTFQGGFVLAESGPGLPKVERTVIQRREPLFFADDFMVTAQEAQTERGWNNLAGTWACKSIRSENAATKEAYYARSANPFAYLGKPSSYKTFALSVRGEPSWSSYSVRASLNSPGEGVGGLAFGCESAKTFWLIRLDFKSRFATPAPIQLVRVQDGRAEVLAERHVRVRRDHWYSLGAEVYHGRVRVSWLGTPIMDVSDRRIVGGPIGLYAEGKDGVVFDDVDVRELARLRFDRADELTGQGEQIAGSWRAKRSDNGTAPCLVPSGRDALVLFGDPSWTGGAVTAEVRLGTRGSAGLVAAANGSVSYFLGLSPDGKGSLVARRGSEEEVLEQFDHTCQPGRWCKVALNLSRQGVVSAYVGGGLVARVKVKDAPKGRIGLFARGARGAAFRNLVANRSQRLLSEHQIGNAIFLSDAYMSSWATETGQWIPDDGPDKARSMSGYSFAGKNEFWRKGDYYGDYVMVLPLTIEVAQPTQPDGTQPEPLHHPITGSLAIHFGLKTGELNSGYSVKAAAKTPGSYTLMFAYKKKVLSELQGLTVADGKNEIRIYNSGRHIWAMFGDRELFSHRKTEPDAGTRIAAVRDGEVDFDRLAVYAENLDDSSFQRAPTNWRIIGDWQITKRFRCDPRWSWMGVDGLKTYSAMWHRREFIGDLTLELYGSMKMRAGNPYYCPSDLNITISADAETPTRGYSFVVGGWKNSKTALFRNGREVAATQRAYLPDTRDSYPASEMLHRRWFYVKVRRKGGRLQLYLDNKLYLDWTDPQPLAGGKIAVWTQEQSIMVARVLVYPSKPIPPADVLVPAPRRQAEEPLRPEPLAVSCQGRQAYFFDFETGTQRWCEKAIGAGNAMPSRDTGQVGPGGGAASLKLVNAECPGRFIATVPVRPINLLTCPELSFDCRIPKGVQVNLYFDVDRTTEQSRSPARVRRRRVRRWRRRPAQRSVGARTYFIALTGPTDSTEGVKRAGRFPNARADGRWHHCAVNIARLMRQFYPTESSLQASNFRFAFDHRATYAKSGFGGNPLGATYHLDNFLLVTAGAGPAVFRWKPYTGAHLGYAAQVSTDRGAQPGTRPDLRAARFTVDEPRGRVSYFHVRPMAANGGPRLPASHTPFYNAGPAAVVTDISPPDRSTWGGEPIRLVLPKEQLPALDTRTIRLTLGGIDVGLDNRALVLDWTTGVLSVDSSQLAVAFDDEAVVDCSLTAGLFGQGQVKPITWQYVASLKRDRTPPGEVHVEGLHEADDFERDKGDWVTSSYAVGAIDRTTSASGSGSLRLFNTYDGGSFLAQRQITGRRVGECPVIEFDYRIGPNVRTDLVISAGGQFSFRLVDRTPQNQIGSVPKVLADGQWHSASVDVFNAFWTRSRLALSSRVNWIGFGDFGWASSREGDAYNIDNFRVLPVVSCRNGLELSWAASDALGVAGCSYLWSTGPPQDAPAQLMSTGETLRLEKLPEGRGYLNIRAVDRAGNWGPTQHYAVIVDNTPPAIQRLTPRPGAKMSPGRFTVMLKDLYGPDPEALRLQIGKRRLTMRSPSLLTARRPSITWDWLLTPELIETIPNGEKITFELSGVRDFAGNDTAPIAGVWTMDYRRDRQPPQRVEFDLVSAPVAFVKRFDTGLDGVGSSGYMVVEHGLARDAVSRLLHLHPRYPSTQAAVVRFQPFDVARTGLIKMDVKLTSAATYLDLLLVGKGFRAKLRVGHAPPNTPKPFSTDKDGYIFLGAMNNAGAKNGWHTQWVDLYPLLRKAFPKLTRYLVTAMRLGRYCQPYCPSRNIYIDNLMVYGYGTADLKVKLRARDVTGLSGYALDAVQSYGGPPAKKVNHKGDEFGRKLSPGVWYLRGLACDNNGNWSAVPGVLPYVVK